MVNSRFKFRAWDTIGKQWLRITGFETAETDVSKGYTIFGKGAGLFHDGDYVGSEGIILSQYTGLKDKNGKEIYEGDLLRHQNGTIAEIRYLNDLAAFVAIYKQNGNTEVDYLDKEIVNKCKVIGNIYENPELFKGEI